MYTCIYIYIYRYVNVYIIYVWYKQDLLPFILSDPDNIEQGQKWCTFGVAGKYTYIHVYLYTYMVYRNRAHISYVFIYIYIYLPIDGIYMHCLTGSYRDFSFLA